MTLSILARRVVALALAASALATAPRVRFDDLALTSYMFCAAMGGPTGAILRGSAPAKMLRVLRVQLESLCMGYLEREASPL